MNAIENIMKIFACHSRSLAALFALTVCACVLTPAQQITGTITGTVKDAKGALVTTATVKITNVATGLTRMAEVGNDGEYQIQYLPVGNYTLQVEAAGFKTFVQKSITVAVDQEQTVNVVLAVGAQTQTVTVSEAPPLIETGSAELGRTVESAEIIGLPLVNRNAYSELSLTPGVQSNSASSQSNPSGTPGFQAGAPATQVIVNGGIDNGSPMVAFYLDGGLNMTGLRDYGDAVPNPDALEEFRVETNNFSAQYGRMSAAVVTAVTKSGTNQLHGSLFEFNRNTDLNATPWNSTTNAPYHRNQFGGVIGGPVKKDKAFFLGSYAGLRQVIGQQLSGGLLPTAAERLGDFTQDSFTVHLPGTTTQVDGTNSGPGCGTPHPNCIPSALLDKTAATMMTKYIPLPNQGYNGYTGYFTGPTDQDEYLGKYDEELTAKDHVAVSYFTLQVTLNGYGGGNIPYSVNQSFSRQQVANLSDIHTFSASTANQAWLTFTRVAGGRVNLPAVSIDSMGSSYTTQGVAALPGISVSGYFSAGGALAGPVSNSDFYSIRDMVSKTIGKHSLSFGGELSMEHDAVIGNLDNFGVFGFASSAPTSTGNAMADFVSGMVSSMEQDTPYHALLSNWYFAGFLQDNFRAMRDLTVNLGLRYDWQQPPVESSNLTATFVPGVQSTVVPSAPRGELFVGDAGVPRGIIGVPLHQFSPRVGISWDPFGDGKTAVHAAAGVFYGGIGGQIWALPSGAQPFAVRQPGLTINSLTNVYAPTLVNGAVSSFPNGDPFPYVYSPASPRFLSAASIQVIGKNAQWPLVYQLNAAIQRQLPKGVAVTIAYVGTLAHDLPFPIDANHAPYAPGATTNANNINARRPYDPAVTPGQLGTLGQVTDLESGQTASYHSLQVSVNRRLSNHLMLNGFYVLSHGIQSVNESGNAPATAQDFDNLWEERGPENTDQRHVASISGIWNLDYYSGSNLVAKSVLNGWTISPIISLQGGMPFTMSTGANKNDDSANANRPDMVAGVNPFLDPHRSRSVARNAWFNTAAFVANGPGVAGGIGPGGADGNTPRNSLVAPGFRDVDLGLFRDFRFERGIVFQIRGEATNAFNLVSLSAPTASLASGNDGKITSAATPRLIQVGARFTF